jgi:hypothetical protein
MMDWFVCSPSEFFMYFAPAVFVLFDFGITIVSE